MASRPKKIPQEVIDYIYNNKDTALFKLEKEILEKFNYKISYNTIKNRFFASSKKTPHKFTEEQLEFLNQELPIEQLTKLFNDKFNTDLSERSIISARHRHDIERSKRAAVIQKDIIDFCKNNLHLSYNELRIQVYKNFNVLFTKKQFCRALTKRGLYCKADPTISTIYLDLNNNNLSDGNVIKTTNKIAAKFYYAPYENAELNETHFKVCRLEQAVKEIKENEQN